MSAIDYDNLYAKLGKKLAKTDPTKKRSGILCRCKRCGARYFAVHHESTKECESCRPSGKCIHGLANTEPCAACRKVTGSQFIRCM